jgi:hypothetical protein
MTVGSDNIVKVGLLNGESKIYIPSTSSIEEIENIM